MRTIHTMFHSTSVTPLSTDTSGSLSSSSSGTRHQSGPAGPIITPATTAATTDVTAARYQRRLPGRESSESWNERTTGLGAASTDAGTAEGTVPASTWTARAGGITERADTAGSAGGLEGLLDGVVHLPRVLDESRPPAGSHVVVHGEDVAVLHGGDLVPAVAGGHGV